MVRLDYTAADAVTDAVADAIEELKTLNKCKLPSDDEILQEIREICNGLALSDRARAMRYDKIVEVLNGRD